MQRTPPLRIREGDHNGGRYARRDGISARREIVLRFAENGYQIEPEALEAICRHSGGIEELVSRIIGSTDRSVAVIGTAQISCLLGSFGDVPPASRNPPNACPTPGR